MEVWKMALEERKNKNELEGDILIRIAQKQCLMEGLTPLYTYGEPYSKIEEKDPIYQERKNEIKKALKNSYERDKRLYYGSGLFLNF
jgi:hypothetical protein